MLEKRISVEISTELQRRDGPRALFTARNRRGFVDAPLALGGPNEEPTPLELLLAALASEAAFVVEYAARQKGIPLREFRVNAAMTFNPLGLIGEPVDLCPHRVNLDLEVCGPSPEQVTLLEQVVVTRSPIYGTLAATVEIQLQMKLDAPMPDIP